MPSIVSELFSAADLVPEGVVRWGTPLPTSQPGVYAVSLTDATDAIDATRVEAPLDRLAFETWLRVRPELTLDGTRPRVEQLMERVGGFWLPDESVLYVGLATTLGSRVQGYYRTPIGARRPHAGGYFLKLLANLDRLWVHYAPCREPDAVEDAMLSSFCSNASDAANPVLIDPAHPFPFANLEWPRGVRKAHGLRGAREPRFTGGVTDRAAPPLPRTIAPPDARGSRSGRTQRVTAADLRAGQSRIPSIGSASTKSLLPPMKGTIDVTLRGRALRAPWDPRMGPDRERSGVLRIGPVLRQLVDADEVLEVLSANGALLIR
jgi:hypothetical protein